MLDIGWTELLLVGVVALLVIGPRDLPGALRTFGKFVGQLRGMARQFQDGLDDIVKQEDLRDLQRTVSSATRPGAIDRYLKSDIDGAPKPTAIPDASDSADANSIAGDSGPDEPNRMEPATSDAGALPAPASDEPNTMEPATERQPVAVDDPDHSDQSDQPSTTPPHAPKPST